MDKANADLDRILGIYFRTIKEQENEINDLREQVFHLTKDQLRLDWLCVYRHSNGGRTQTTEIAL
jgi:hypothetical protein